MDIEAISGPRITGTVRPALRTEDPEQMDSITPVILFSLDIRDKVSISPEARRRYEERHRHRQERKHEARENT
ncbi:MAG: hypothetical protein C4538_02540 [Nitrospiraceae bacterium]|nr:MAG: hypothetical protein C4538_02540 [Nitrospiraceae bacterium]